MTPRHINPIVEGYGDSDAVPQLIRRIANGVGVYDIAVRRPHRLPRSKMDSDSLDKAVVAHRDADLVIVVLDADEDDPEDLREALVRRTHEVHTIIAIAVHEYESWLLAGVASLRGASVIQDDAAYELDPEKRRDAKGELQGLMTVKYRETLHQVKLTAQVDLDLVAERSPSFARFRDELSAALTSQD